MRPLALVLVLLSLGCQSTVSPASDAGAVDAATPPPSDAGPPPQVTLTGLAHDVDNVPIPTMQVCVYEHAEIPCGITDDGGTWRLQVPASSELLITFEKTGWERVMRTADTGASGGSIGGLRHLRQTEADALATALGGPFDPTKGRVRFDAWTPGARVLAGQPVMGATATTSATGAPAPVYLDVLSLPGRMQTSTGAFGNGLLVGLTPGEVDVTVTHPTLVCARFPLRTWAPRDASADARMSRVRVVAGWVVYGASVYCER